MPTVRRGTHAIQRGRPRRSLHTTSNSVSPAMSAASSILQSASCVRGSQQSHHARVVVRSRLFGTHPMPHENAFSPVTIPITTVGSKHSDSLRWRVHDEHGHPQLLDTTLHHCYPPTDKTVPSPWRQPYNFIIPVTTGRAQLQKIGSETSSTSAFRTLVCPNKRMPALSQGHACSRLLAPILEASRI